MVCVIGRSATTVLSVCATVAIVALASAAPPLLRALDMRSPLTALTQPSADQTTATSNGSAQPAVTTADTLQVPIYPGNFHASWVSQSEHASLAAGETTTMTVRFRNAGTVSWLRGVLGQQANLGVSGDGAQLASNWPAADRVAVQAEPVVQPGGVGTFTFTVRAPTSPGGYRLDLRPVIDGTTWMENEGVYFNVTSQALEERGTAIGALPSQAPMVVFAIFAVALLLLLVRLTAAAGRTRFASAAGR